MRAISYAVLLEFLPYAAAFYPYELPHLTRSERRRGRQEHGNGPTGTFSVPLRRTSIKRDNIFNIISAKPPTQMNSIGVDQDGTDFSYFSSFKFGSSEEEYHLLIDSAASNSWVMGSECINSACEAHNTFGEGDSDTLTITNAPFEIVYGTGSVSGRYAEDTAHFAGFSTPMIFGLASNVSSDFLRYPMDGILALARPDTLTSGDIHPTVIDSLRESNLISNKVFGIHLSRHADGENDGELNFGAPNQDRYDNDLTYIPAITDDRGFWQIALDAAGVDGTMLHLPSRTIILDTGTSFILTPHEDAASLHSLIPFSTSDGETFKIPCRSTQTVHFVLGGRTFNISHLDYVGRSDGLEGDMCYSNIIGRTTFGDAQWLVGDVFFKNVYTIFDYDEARIGLGVKKPRQLLAEIGPSDTGSIAVPASRTMNRGASATTDTAEETGHVIDLMGSVTTTRGGATAPAAEDTARPTSTGAAVPMSRSGETGIVASFFVLLASFLI